MEKLKGKKPNIRFPEFKDDWEHKAIGELFALHPRPISKPTVNYKSIGIRSHFKGTFQRLDSDPSKNVMDTLYVVKENDLMVNITFAWEGAVAIASKDDEGGLVSHRFPTYVNDKEKVEINFFRFLFPTNDFKRTLELISPGSAGRNRVLKKSDFLKIKFLLPTLPEQKRIAAFFTVVDKKIAELKQKKALLEQYKKGVMQKLFSQELRFKDENGNEFPKWEKKKLGELTEKINSGKTPLGGESVYTTSGILFIRSQNIIDNKLSLDNSTYIPVEINNTMKNSIVIANDILLNITGASLGRSCVVPKDFEIGNVNQHVCIIRMNKQNEPRFVQAYFSTNEGQKLFNTLQTGSGREGLNFQSIRNISMYMPSLEEQAKISNFLSAIDEKINRTQNQIQQTQEWKKGLLQNMLV